MNKETTAVVLAAGRGSRLQCPDLTKAMVPIAGRHLLNYPLEILYKAAFNSQEIVVVVGHKKEMVREFLGQDVQIREQPMLNGNAEALKIAMEGLSPEIKTILVLQVDDTFGLTPETIGNFLRLHERARAAITLLLTSEYNPTAHRNQYLLGPNRKILAIRRQFIEPREGNFFAGVYAFDRSFLDKYLPQVVANPQHKGELTLPQLFDLYQTNSSLQLLDGN